eukprot:NODE_3317_length_1373_cov_199.166400_g2427_i1.p1 GENE.NODE_3317_length_1373_cov_199.166400_g2427_i1~~NODE_3317_length_1373_cov_199.166400_g2427_i1.p1  ORF type:complete len:389 (+),score=60.25 NODE_3317_length_1373_cov_199.166400_g2427_i1:68-1234(+)
MMKTLRLSLIGTRKMHAKFDIFNPTPEHKSLREMLQSFVTKDVEPQALEWNRKEKFNKDLFKKLGDLGLLGLTASSDYGGSGMDALASCIVHEELSKSDPAFCLSYLAHSLLFVNNINVNCSPEQKSEYLPDVCSGAKIGGMCMSEPGAGTDVLGMKSTAKRDGDYYILNGTKMWITNGPVGDVFLVYARTGTGSRGISSFLVESSYKGFSVGQEIKDKCGMRASATAELVFDNVRVPARNLIGTEGSAVKCMMRNLEIERVGLAAMSMGIAARCVEVMTRYSNERHAFGQPLHHFGQIQKHISDSYSKMQAGRYYLYNLAYNINLEEAGHRVETDGVKLFCTTAGKEIADSAIQVLGGYGYTGPYVVERLWRDSKLLEIGGGTFEKP